MFSFEINPPKFHNSLPNPTISYSNNEIEKMTMALDKKWKRKLKAISVLKKEIIFGLI